MIGPRVPGRARCGRRPGTIDRRAAWALLPGLAALAMLAWPFATQRVRTVYEAESTFGRIRVTERGDGLRTLYTGAGRARQSAIYPGEPLRLVLPYTRVAAVGLALAADEPRILFVGLGGGAMPMHARAVRPDARIDVVEIDPLIVAVARRWFGFAADERMRVHTGDGRAFIERAPPRTWDLIVLDAFADDEIPAALTTRQFLDAVRTRLAPGGVVLANLWSAHAAYGAMLATYLEAFDQVRLVRVPGRSQRILIAGLPGRPLDRPSVLAAARTLGARGMLGFDLSALVRSGWEPVPAVAAPVLEDPEEAAILTPSS